MACDGIIRGMNLEGADSLPPFPVAGYRTVSAQNISPLLGNCYGSNVISLRNVTEQLADSVRFN